MAGDQRYFDDPVEDEKKTFLSSSDSSTEPLLPSGDNTFEHPEQEPTAPPLWARLLLALVTALVVFFTYDQVASAASGGIQALKDAYRGAHFSPCAWLGHHKHHGPPPHLDPAYSSVSGMLEGFVRPHRPSKDNSGLSDVYKTARQHEEAFLKVPSPQSARDALKRYTDRLHVAGSDADFESALQIQKEWADLLGAPEKDPKDLLFDAGSLESRHFLTGDWSVPAKDADQRRPPHRGPPPQRQPGKPRVWTDTYYVWLNGPKGKSSLSLGPAPTEDNPSPEPEFVAKLEEDVLDQDPTSGKGNFPYHGYSKPGSASGPLVYAGFCTVDDFATLKKKGVKVDGAITLCRYGGVFRGLKVRASADAGAVATLIYSDPLEDGNVTEANGFKAYPDGPARQRSSVQRGSVQALSIYPGDPATPFKPSYKNASRLRADDADSLPKIPSVPISYEDASHLLNALKGSGVNAANLEKESGGKQQWVGKVPGVDEYWTGPSKSVASVTNNVDEVSTKPIWNTYAFIPGHIQDEVVITAVHRDAWTFGGADPSSGTAAMHEVVAGLGSLTKTGWKPLRSILIASWDGEEYGLVGSTEFGEDYAEWLRHHAVAYFNTDVAAAGSKFKIGASPSLAELYRSVGRQVQDPESSDNSSTLQINRVAPLGSGSDFSVFLQHLGIPSSDIGYTGNPAKDPVYHYHSNYDSFHWMDKFGDPEFKRITTIAKVLGLATLRTAQSPFLPLNVGDYSGKIQEYVDSAEKDYKHAVEKGSIEGEATRRGKNPFARVDKDVKGLQKAAKKLQTERFKLEKALDRALKRRGPPPGGRKPHDHPPREGKELRGPSHPHPHPPHPHPHPHSDLIQILRRIASYNYKLSHFEQSFIHPDGLRLRPWYRSLLVGPGRWRGYGATPLPGVKESIKLDHDIKGMEYELERVDEAINKAKKLIESRGKFGPPNRRPGHGPPGDGPGQHPPHEHPPHERPPHERPPHEHPPHRESV